MEIFRLCFSPHPPERLPLEVPGSRSLNFFERFWKKSRISLGRIDCRIVRLFVPIMRILLEDKGTGLYLAAPGEWIKNPEKAQGFRNEREAVEAAVREKIINGALAYRFPIQSAIFPSL